MKKQILSKLVERKNSVKNYNSETSFVTKTKFFSVFNSTGGLEGSFYGFAIDSAITGQKELLYGVGFDRMLYTTYAGGFASGVKLINLNTIDKKNFYTGIYEVKNPGLLS